MVSVFTKTGTFKRGLGSTFSRGFREQRGLLPVNEPALELFIFIRSCRSLIFQIFPEGELCPCSCWSVLISHFQSFNSGGSAANHFFLLLVTVQSHRGEISPMLSCQTHGNSALLLLVKSSQSGEELAKIQYHTELL